MLSVRNVVVGASLLLVVAVVTSVVSMLQTPDSGGLANDSFGTRGQGFRGLFEVLSESGLPTTRNLAPPDATGLADTTLVLLGPNPRIVGFEPSYLLGLQRWVEQGGRIVVAPQYRDPLQEVMLAELDEPPPTVLEALGLDGVDVTYAESSSELPWRSPSDRSLKVDEIAQKIMEGFSGPLQKLIDVPVELDGELATLAAGVTRLRIPADSIATLAIDEQVDRAGSVVWIDEHGQPQTLVARFVRGKGEILVVSDPQLFANRLIAGGDNSVLAVQLISPNGQAVQFDEFYHGLGVRGSPLYLLTRPQYATVSLGLLLPLALWTWRKAVFVGPPLPDVETRRRDISEYINAMGRFFAVDSRGRGWLVQQVRDGVLRQICDEVGLPTNTLNIERIAAILARRDVHRSEMLVEAANAVDFELQARRYWSESQTLDAMQRMTDCLSRNVTRPFVPKCKRSSSGKTT